MSMRFFFTGPRIFGIRPGIIFGASDLRKVFGTTATTVRGRGAMTGSFLYVIRGDHNLVKIGVSTNPNARIAQTANGIRLPDRLFLYRRNAGHRIRYARTRCSRATAVAANGLT
jgi:hypothetical protein